jgi:hypothetical protein
MMKQQEQEKPKSRAVSPSGFSLSSALSEAFKTLSMPAPGTAKGATATLLMHNSLQNNTLAEFKPKLPLSFFHQRANLFAFTLLRLWTPIYPHETTNFVPQFNLSEKKILNNNEVLTNVRPFHESSATRMNQHFMSLQAQNLGALTMLNLLMSGKLHGKSLRIVQSPETQALFFSQAWCPFWIDFFLQEKSMHWFSSEPIDIKFMGFQRDNPWKAWWRTAFHRGDQALNHSTHILPRSLCTNECIDTAMRLYLTPNELLDNLMDDILGEHPLTDAFKKYFFARFERFKQTFESMALFDNAMDWNEYMTENGAHYFNEYNQYISTFDYSGWDKQSACRMHFSPSIFAPLLVQAISLGIEDLSPLLRNKEILEASMDDQIFCFSYTITESQRLWNLSLVHQPNHSLWLLMNEFATRLDSIFRDESIKLSLSSDQASFLISCLMKSIQFHHDALASFLICHSVNLANQSIASSKFLLSSDSHWIGHSLVYFAKTINHEPIHRLLKNHGMQLFAHESVAASLSTHGVFDAKSEEVSIESTIASSAPIHDNLG